MASPQWENLKFLKQEYSTANMTERLAFYTIEKLKKSGYDCELLKPTVKPRTWRVYPKNRSEMNKQELAEFERIKNETVDELKKEERQALKGMGRSLFGT